MATETSSTANTPKENPSFKAKNIRIEKNVLVWGNAVLPISNISVLFKINNYTEFDNPDYRTRMLLIFLAFLAWLIIGLTLIIDRNTALLGLIYFIASCVAFYYCKKHGKKLLPAKKVKTSSYSIKIVMNSGNTFNVEVKSRSFRDLMAKTLTSIIENGGTSETIHYDGDYILNINDGIFENSQFNNASNVFNGLNVNSKK